MFSPDPMRREEDERPAPAKTVNNFRIETLKLIFNVIKLVLQTRGADGGKDDSFYRGALRNPVEGPRRGAFGPSPKKKNGACSAAGKVNARLGLNSPKPAVLKKGVRQMSINFGVFNQGREKVSAWKGR